MAKINVKALLFCWAINMIPCLLTIMCHPVHACTLTHVHAKDTLVIGRTMELGPEPPWSVWTSPKDWKKGQIYNAVHIGSRVFGGRLQMVTDGMNSKGLTVSAHTFVGSQYQRANVDDSTVSFLDFVPYVLSRFASVEETIKALSSPNIRVVVPRDGMDNPSFFVHWGIQDVFGQSCVVEYLNGELQVHNSTDIGVMTNDPEYNWHLTFLNSFAGVGNAFVKPNANIQYKKNNPRWTSHGFNLLGVPGDLGPPARFVRTYLLKQLSLDAFPVKSVEDGFVLLDKLLAAVSIPKGSVGPESPKDKDFDYTQWSLIKIPGQKVIYIRTYSQATWRKIDLNKIKFNGRTKIFDLSTKWTRRDFMRELLRAEKLEAFDHHQQQDDDDDDDQILSIEHIDISSRLSSTGDDSSSSSNDNIRKKEENELLLSFS